MKTQNKPLYIGHAFLLAYMELPDDQRLALFDMVLADFFEQKNLAKTPTEKAMLHLVRGYVEGLACAKGENIPFVKNTMNAQDIAAHIQHYHYLASTELPDDQRLAFNDMMDAYAFENEKNIAKTPTEKAMLHLVLGLSEVVFYAKKKHPPAVDVNTRKIQKLSHEDNYWLWEARKELPDDQRLAFFDMMDADYYEQKNIAKTPTEKDMLYMVQALLERWVPDAMLST